MNEAQTLRWEEDQQRLFSFMQIPWPYVPPAHEWAEKTDPTKIVSLSDPHEPYSAWQVLEHIQNHEKDAETVIVPGDLGDYYSKSRFRKTRHQSFAEELKSVFIRLEWLSKHWKVVKVMLGNHDNRPEKHMAQITEGSVDMLIMTESNMLERLISFFPNVELVGVQLDKTDTKLSHIYQHGDILFTHGELSLKSSTGILDRVEDYLDEWSDILQLKPYRVLAQAHNHRGSKEEGRRTRFLLPTASNPYGIGLEYIYGPRMIGKPPTIGYSVFYQKDGVTDTNRSHNVKFEIRDGQIQPLS